MKIKCSVSLSKKLREIIQNGSPIVLEISSISNGRGIGSINFSENVSGRNLADKLIGDETSIMLRPLEWTIGAPVPKSAYSEKRLQEVKQEPQYADVENVENVEDVEDVEPEGQIDDTGAVGSLFSQTAYSKPSQGPRTAVDRIAATEPPKSRTERVGAIKRREEVAIPEEFKELENPKVRKFIADANDFYEAVLMNKNKKSDIDIESITNPRQRAVAEEQKSMDESIGLPTYIVNEKYASLQINDLSISLPKDSPIDLSRIPAKKLYESRDLKTIIDKEWVRFVTPEEAAYIIQKTANPGEQDGDEAQTFSSYKEAQRALQRGDDDDGDSPETLDLADSLEGPTEQEQMAGLINLTPQAPQSGSRKTVHGGTMSARPTSPTSPNSSGKVVHQQHRAIKRVGE